MRVSPGTDWTVSSPECSCTMRRAVSRPSPVPCPTPLVVKNGSKIWAWTFGGMPGPLWPFSTSRRSRSRPDTLVSEELLENMGLDFRRDARSVVADFDQQAIQLAGGADAQFALALHGVDGVVDQVGPDLVQLAAARADLRQAAVEIELHIDTLFEAVPQHQQRAFDPLVDVHFLLRTLIHISVLFNRADQIGDAAGGVFDLIEQSSDGEGSGDACEEIGPRLRGELRGHAVEPGSFAARIHQGGRQV